MIAGLQTAGKLFSFACLKTMKSLVDGIAFMQW